MPTWPDVIVEGEITARQYLLEIREIARINRPSLVIGTRDDATVPFYFAEDLADAVPGAPDSDERLNVLMAWIDAAWPKPPEGWTTLHRSRFGRGYPKLA